MGAICRRVTIDADLDSNRSSGRVYLSIGVSTLKRHYIYLFTSIKLAVLHIVIACGDVMPLGRFDVRITLTLTLKWGQSKEDFEST